MLQVGPCCGSANSQNITAIVDRLSFHKKVGERSLGGSESIKLSQFGFGSLYWKLGIEDEDENPGLTRLPLNRVVLNRAHHQSQRTFCGGTWHRQNVAARFHASWSGSPESPQQRTQCRSAGAGRT